MFRAPGKYAGMFEVGDRVRLARPIASGDREPVGTIAGFIAPEFAVQLAAPDDVIVRWDSGLELTHAPSSLMCADHC